MAAGMVGIDAAIARIRSYALHRGWKKSRLAAEAGLSDTTLRDFDGDRWNPTAETIRTIEAIIPADFQGMNAIDRATGAAA
jgi:ribosome-binding protein aMBF1 (putative translation factor)